MFITIGEDLGTLFLEFLLDEEETKKDTHTHTLISPEHKETIEDSDHWRELLKPDGHQRSKWLNGLV